MFVSSAKKNKYKKCKEPSKKAFFSFHNARRVFGSRRRRRREPRVSPSFKRASPPVAATIRPAALSDLPSASPLPLPISD